jgi:SAM-dependent methyltransferase
VDVQIYHEWAEFEETHWWFIGRKRIFSTIIDGYLGGKPSQRICDIGCGAGAMIPVLSRYGSVWGIETSELAIGYCRENGINNIVMANSMKLPFKDESLDALALFDVIEHVDDDIGVLNECRRVCKKGGTLIVSVPAYQFLMSPNDIVADHKRRYSLGVLSKKLGKSGFRIRKSTYYNFFLFPPILVVVLIRKVLWRLMRGEEKGIRPKGNISYKTPALVNSVLLSIMTFESAIIKKSRFPFGHSLVCAATKE